nr:MAG TPA: hypothetical protein [Caudoviricetes sp.]
MTPYILTLLSSYGWLKFKPCKLNTCRAFFYPPITYRQQPFPVR